MKPKLKLPKAVIAMGYYNNEGNLVAVSWLEDPCITPNSTLVHISPIKHNEPPIIAKLRAEMNEVLDGCEQLLSKPVRNRKKKI